MDFLNQSSPQSANTAPQAGVKKSEKKKQNGKPMRILSAVMLVSVTMLLGFLALYLGIGGGKNEASYVDTSKFQAIFLNNTSQPPYFAKIRSINSKYITIDNIYYLLVNQQVQPSSNSSTSNDVKLVKLGCELHGPYDKMIINRDQVLYWENLKEDGQVAQAITKYVQANPNGQKCETTTAETTTTDNATTTNE